MPNITQENRLLKLTTPLGEDKLLIRSIDGMEGISQLFSYRIDAFAPNEEAIDFSRLIGQPACVRVNMVHGDAGEITRAFHGIIQTATRGARGDFNTGYSFQLVPQLWVLTRVTQSRIFQQKTVTDILKAVIGNIPAAWETQGTYEPRDYCVQYRESDFDFLSRLMEEEGIFYYFRHTEDGHTIVFADSAQTHVAIPHAPTLYYDPYTGGVDEAEIIYAWEKTQSLRSGKTTLWDHSFELPHKNLEAQDLITETLQVGDIVHKLKVGSNDTFELYDYPGGYAERFDGVSPSGGEQASELQKIFEDNKRTTKIRMQQEAVNSISSTGYTAFLGVTAGFKFALERHYEDNDTYVITRISFSIPQGGNYNSGDTYDGPPPEAVINCIPLALPFRPQRVSPKPVIYGTQTAVVVGPSGEEIFTDKYARIKVQFLWDRAAKYDGTSSCWVRCAMPWAGKNFGFTSIPRVGQEVVIAFEEGNPDQPICVGSVYNADMMPSYTLPDNKTMSTFKSRSSPGGGGFNELRFEDKKDAEQVFFQAQKDMDLRVLNDRKEWIGQDTHLYVKRDQVEAILRDVQRKVTQDVVEEIGRDRVLVIKGKDTVEVTGSSTAKIGGNSVSEITGNQSVKTTGTTYIKGSGAIVIESAQQISLKVGGNFIDIGPAGVAIKGAMVLINSGGAAGSGALGSLNASKAPAAALEASTAEAGGAKTYSGGAYTGNTYQRGASLARGSGGGGGGGNPPPSGPTHNPSSPENQQKTHWVGIVLKDRLGNPIPGQAYHVVLPNGEIVEGTLDDQGKAKIEHIDPGECKVTFPGLADAEKA